MIAEFDRLMMLGFRAMTGVDPAGAVPSIDVDEADLGIADTGVLILIDGARVRSGAGRLASAT